MSAALIVLAVAMLHAPGSASAEVPPGAEGKAAELPLPEGTLADGLTLGPEGDLWFLLSGVGVPSNAIGKLTGSGAIETFPVSTSASGASGYPTMLQGITVGADGRLWFGSANGAGGAVGSISTAGEVGLLPLAQPTRNPTSIAAGTGGGIWFTISGRGYRSWIGDVAPDGEVHEYRIPEKVFAEGIAAGPGDAMWFLATTPGRPWPPGGVLGKITGTGQISRWPIPGAGLTAGPAASGGRTWFGAELDEPVIASADVRGRIRELPLPSPSGESGYVNSIAPAPGGGVWFVGNDPQILGRVSPGGEVRRTLLQAEPGFFGSLTVGREGDLWATNSREGTLLRIEPRIPGSHLRQLGALRRQGPVRVKIGCDRSSHTCHGTLRLSHERTGESCCGPIQVAFAPYRVPAGGTGVVTIEVGAEGRAELRRAARHGHFVTVGAFEPGGFAADRPLLVAGVGAR
jgi:virginiamycin B lyase